MVFLREALTLVAGLALTKIIVDRTTDELNTPDILPKIPDSPTKFVGLPDREEQIEEKLRGLP
tara:strand:- start:135 stop:323 length:189 start_codon:yes stop_codon:yes gene_type:complete